jgi:hypothetical protein
MQFQTHEKGKRKEKKKIREKVSRRLYVADESVWANTI